jgi:hypothetical protein
MGDIGWWVGTAMIKSTGIVGKAIYTKEGKMGIVKDIIFENSRESPDWWVSHLEIELDETFKKELFAAKKLTQNKSAATLILKLTGFGKGAVNLTEKGVEINATRAQAGDNIGTLDAFFKPIKIAKSKLSL